MFGHRYTALLHYQYPIASHTSYTGNISYAKSNSNDREIFSMFKNTVELTFRKKLISSADPTDVKHAGHAEGVDEVRIWGKYFSEMLI